MFSKRDGEILEVMWEAFKAAIDRFNVGSQFITLLKEANGNYFVSSTG